MFFVLAFTNAGFRPAHHLGGKTMRNVCMCGIAVLMLTVCLLGGYFYFSENSLKEISAQHSQRLEADKEETEATYPERAAKWTTDAWRDENGVVATYGLANAIAQRDTYLAAHSTATTDGFGFNGTANMNWLSKGPQNVGGRTRSLVFDPNDPTGDTLWVGSVTGGIWKSTSGGGPNSVGQYGWIAMNGGLQNYAINCMIADPQPSGTPPILWAGTGEAVGSNLAGGGLFKSTNGGMSWSVVEQSSFTGNKWQYVDSLAVTHYNGQTYLFAGVQRPVNDTQNSDFGLMRSTDGGTNWSQVYNARTAFSIVVDPNNPGNILADVVGPSNLNKNRVIYSTDAGDNWTMATRFVPSPTSTSTPQFTPTASPTTTPSPAIAPQPPQPPFETDAAKRIVKLIYYKFDSSIVYAQEVSVIDDGQSQIYISRDGGHSFTTDGRTGVTTYSNYKSLFWVSPLEHESNLMITGGTALSRSMDGGVLFQGIAYNLSNIGDEPHGDSQYAINSPTYSSSNKKVYVMNDGGIYSADDIGAAGVSFIGWRNLNKGYVSSQFYTATGDARVTSRIIAGGAQDQGSHRMMWWSQEAARIGDGDGTSTAVDGKACFSQSNGDLRRTLSCDLHFPVMEDIHCGVPDYIVNGVCLYGGISYVPWRAQMKVDETNSNRFFFGASSVWRSDNIKALDKNDITWTEVRKSPLLTASPSGSQTPFSNKAVEVTGMDVHPTNSNIVWVAENKTLSGGAVDYGRLFRTDNALATPNASATPCPSDPNNNSICWSKVDDNPAVAGSSPFPDRPILKVLIDPGDSQRVYVGFAGGSTSLNGENNLYRTTDNGEHWADITGDNMGCVSSGSLHGLPCVPIRAIAINPNHREIIYVGTDIGIYVTNNVNASSIEWCPVTGVLGNTKVSDLNFLRGSNILLAATFGRGLWTANLSPTPPPIKVSNDFDGDGRSDLAVVRDDGVHLDWHIQGSTEAYRSQQLGAEGDQVAPEDYDGDGKADISVFRPSESRWYSLLSSTGTLATTDLGDENSEKVPADFDGDGLADKAVFKPFDGTWEVQQSANGHLIFQFGLPGDKPVTMDFSGDGKADFGVFHEALGMQTLSYYDGTTTRQKQFGLEGDIPVSGDYDGDGKADIAFWRPDDDGDGNGCWYITFATNGYEGYDEIPWGLNGDIPAAGDYDGDGKMDIAVFRPSAGMWHILESSNGYYSDRFGAAGDMPVGVKTVYSARSAGAPHTPVPANAVPRRRTFNTDKSAAAAE